jgi:hypothetical protein
MGTVKMDLTSESDDLGYRPSDVSSLEEEALDLAA